MSLIDEDPVTPNHLNNCISPEILTRPAHQTNVYASLQRQSADILVGSPHYRGSLVTSFSFCSMKSMSTDELGHTPSDMAKTQNIMEPLSESGDWPNQDYSVTHPVITSEGCTEYARTEHQLVELPEVTSFINTELIRDGGNQVSSELILNSPVILEGTTPTSYLKPSEPVSSPEPIFRPKLPICVADFPESVFSYTVKSPAMTEIQGQSPVSLGGTSVVTPGIDISAMCGIDECFICQKVFLGPSQLEIHMSTFHGKCKNGKALLTEEPLCTSIATSKEFNGSLTPRFTADACYISTNKNPDLLSPAKAQQIICESIASLLPLEHHGPRVISTPEVPQIVNGIRIAHTMTSEATKEENNSSSVIHYSSTEAKDEDELYRLSPMISIGGVQVTELTYVPARNPSSDKGIKLTGSRVSAQGGKISPEAMFQNVAMSIPSLTSYMRIDDQLKEIALHKEHNRQQQQQTRISYDISITDQPPTCSDNPLIVISEWKYDRLGKNNESSAHWGPSAFLGQVTRHPPEVCLPMSTDTHLPTVPYNDSSPVKTRDTIRLQFKPCAHCGRTFTSLKSLDTHEYVCQKVFCRSYRIEPRNKKLEDTKYKTKNDEFRIESDIGTARNRHIPSTTVRTNGKVFLNTPNNAPQKKLVDQKKRFVAPIRRIPEKAINDRNGYTEQRIDESQKHSHHKNRSTPHPNKNRLVQRYLKTPVDDIFKPHSTCSLPLARVQRDSGDRGRWTSPENHDSSSKTEIKCPSMVIRRPHICYDQSPRHLYKQHPLPLDSIEDFENIPSITSSISTTASDLAIGFLRRSRDLRGIYTIKMRSTFDSIPPFDISSIDGGAFPPLVSLGLGTNEETGTSMRTHADGKRVFDDEGDYSTDMSWLLSKFSKLSEDDKLSILCAKIDSPIKSDISLDVLRDNARRTQPIHMISGFLSRYPLPVHHDVSAVTDSPEEECYSSYRMNNASSLQNPTDFICAIPIEPRISSPVRQPYDALSYEE